MRLVFVRQGQELEAARELLGAAEGSIRARAQSATLESGQLRDALQEEDESFALEIAQLEADHRDRMTDMSNEAAALNAEASELTDQAGRVRNATNVLD